MNTVVKIFLTVFYSMTLIISCNDREQVSAFENIFQKASFIDITDSIKQDNKNPELFFRRSILLQKENYTDAAIADLQTAWDLSGNEEYAFELSNLLLDKKPAAAEKLLLIAIEKFPSSIFLKLNLARAQSALNKTDEAIQTTTALLQKEPAMIDAWMLKAELQEKKGDDSGALLSLENAYTLAPFDVELSYELAFKYAESKNPKAISLADSLISMDASASHAEPYYFKAVYYYNINNKTKALELFSEAILHNHNFLDAYLEKGRILYEQKKHAEALKVFQLATQVSITFADGYFWMGKCQEALNKKQEAKENYNRAYGLDKTLAEAKVAADRIK
jgi:tetratricopeptide (TPR) repeat protein